MKVLMFKAKILPAGETCLFVDFGEKIDMQINSLVQGLKRSLTEKPFEGMRELVPTYRSLSVYFDPLTVDLEALNKRLMTDLESITEELDEDNADATQVNVPVFFGGEFGPDLSDVAEHTKLSVEEVIKRYSPSSDRMGTLFESDNIIEHVKGPDIVSDAIPMGAVQIPGQGVPIVMMADRQTTGGYVKIGVVHALDVARLSQFMPGSSVCFAEITQEQGIEISKAEANLLNLLRSHVEKFNTVPPATASQNRGAMNVIVNGEKFFVTWEKLS